MSARVRTSPAFGVLGVDRLFNASGFLSNGAYPIYDVSRDGQRFLMLDIPFNRGADATGRLVLVQNFAGELNRRLPRGGAVSTR
jgi:hypothetical protein